MSIYPTVLHVYSVYHNQQYSIFIESVKKYFFQPSSPIDIIWILELDGRNLMNIIQKVGLYFREIRMEGAEGIWEEKY